MIGSGGECLNLKGRCEIREKKMYAAEVSRIGKKVIVLYLLKFGLNITILFSLYISMVFTVAIETSKSV